MCHGADDDGAGLWRRGALAERRELDGLHDCISKPAAVEFLNRVVPPEARESSGGFVGDDPTRDVAGFDDGSP